MKPKSADSPLEKQIKDLWTEEEYSYSKIAKTLNINIEKVRETLAPKHIRYKADFVEDGFVASGNFRDNPLNR